MSRTVGKKNLHISDIWMDYAAQLLQKNPGWWSFYKDRIKHYSIGYYNDLGTKVEVMSYPRYRKLMEQYFDRAKTAIIKGQVININGGVGRILMKRVERDFRSKSQHQIDWAKTSQQPKVWSEKKQRYVAENLIYHTGDDWIRVFWKRANKLTNETMYEFKPSGANKENNSGFKLELFEALKEDPLLKFRYFFQPLKLPKEES